MLNRWPAPKNTLELLIHRWTKSESLAQIKNMEVSTAWLQRTHADCQQMSTALLQSGLGPWIEELTFETSKLNSFLHQRYSLNMHQVQREL